MGVVDALNFAVSLGRDDDPGACFSNFVAQVIGVVALVGNHGPSVEPVDKIMRDGDVIALPRRGDQTDRIAERIAGGVDFGAQSASRPAQALGIRPPFTLRAPAAC
jgi:hypothetical protein